MPLHFWFSSFSLPTRKRRPKWIVLSTHSLHVSWVCSKMFEFEFPCLTGIFIRYYCGLMISQCLFSVAMSILYPVGCFLLGSYILYVRPGDKRKLNRDICKKLQFFMSIAWYLKLVEGTIEAPLQFSLTVSHIDYKCQSGPWARAGRELELGVS